MPTLFTKIISGEIPCHKVMEDKDHLAFLDIRPVKRGHTLVIPKKESDYLFALADEELCALMRFAKKAAVRLKKAVPCKRVGVMVAGLEVPHTHVHLIPMDSVRDLNFANAQTASAEELAQTSEAIRQAGQED
ncbi:MAG: HIT family protein [Candidatus Omnitrophota bacterium]